MIVKLLSEHHLEFLSLKGGCRGSSELTHVKMPHCWKSHTAAHMYATIWLSSSLAVNHTRYPPFTFLFVRRVIAKVKMTWDFDTYRIDESV